MRGKRPAVLTAKLLARWPLPRPDGGTDKDGRGRVLVVAGSRAMPGAAILAANAALRAGAGKVQIAVPRSIAIGVACQVVEAFVHGVPETPSGDFAPGARTQLLAASKTADAVLIGPAMTETRSLGPLVIELLESLRADQVAVLDAGALAAMAAHRPRLAALACTLCITPHAGEMATLRDTKKTTVEASPLEIAVQTAAELSAIVALKGADTYITDGETVVVNRAGDVGLATSGSGDTMSGVLVGLAARGTLPLHATAWAVHLHAKAGERLARRMGALGYLPRELLAEIPSLMAGRRA